MVNWRILALGTLTAGVGKWAYDAGHNSPWLLKNMPDIARTLMSLTVVWEVLVVFGVILATFGLLWGRWILAIILGSAAAVIVFMLSFAPGA